MVWKARRRHFIEKTVVSLRYYGKYTSRPVLLTMGVQVFLPYGFWVADKIDKIKLVG